MLYLSLRSSIAFRNITRGIVPRITIFIFIFICSFSLLFHIVSPNTENTDLALFSVRNPYCIMRSVVVVKSKRICVNILVVTYPKNSCESRVHSASSGIRVASRPPHTAALGDPDERTGADDRLGKRGAWRALPGTDRSLPGMEDNSFKMEMLALLLYLCTNACDAVHLLLPVLLNCCM